MRYVVRDFAVVNLHEQALKASEAAACAPSAASSALGATDLLLMLWRSTMMIVGAQRYAVFREAIEALLSSQK